MVNDCYTITGALSVCENVQLNVLLSTSYRYCRKQ